MRASSHIALVLTALVAAQATAQFPFGNRGSAGAQPYAGPALSDPASATFPQGPSQNQAVTQATAVEQSPVITGELFEPGEVLAIVGDQYILAADVLPHVNQVLEAYKGKVPDEQLRQQRRVIVAQITAAHIEVKLLYLAFLRKAPPEQVKNVHKKVDADFDKKLEELRAKVEKMKKEEYADLMKADSQLGRLVLVMKDAGVWSPSELDALLRKYGGSLAQERRYYAEYNLGRAMVRQGLNFQPVITHDDMLRYYQEHLKDYDVPTRVRFEIMSVRFSGFRSKPEALQAMCAMGNEVYYGANFAAVAKRSSQGLNAESGGYHDWTSPGTLASKRLDEALFTLEPGKLSQVIEDEQGYHILRVLERQEAGRTPFEVVQTQITEKIKQERVGKQYKEFVSGLREGVTVWTAFDEDPQLSRMFRPGDQTKR